MVLKHNGRSSDTMKKILNIIIATVLISIYGKGVSAANIEGHQQYKIVSYSFSSDDTNITDEPIHYGTLLITESTADILTDSLYGSGASDPKLATDVFAVSADYNATPDLSLFGTIGITKNRWDAALNSDYDSSWEANLGVIYKLFNNISYEIHFGYMDTGDLFKENQAYSDVESIIMISNKLTMSF